MNSVYKASLPVTSSDAGSFLSYVREINKIPSLSKDEERSLAVSYIKDSDIFAAQKLVKSHLKLVVKLAIGYKNYGFPVQDLVSEGNIGLMQGVKKYNPELGFRLSTYATWWIKAYIQEYILKSWSLVKIGTTAAQKKLFFSLGRIKNKIVALCARQVSDADFSQIAQQLGVERKDVLEMDKRLSGPDISLNIKNKDEDGCEAINLIKENRPDQEISIIKKESYQIKHNALIDSLKILSQRERDVIKMRKLKDSPVTLDELSIKYNISKERVRQIEAKAFEKMRTFILNATQARLA